uniref:PRC-barrel domain containing protein n=1 Tax=Sphingomonas sp. KSM1 TaxID=1228049 RepID=M1VHL9_9SPHN|nr:PRC-barrel domain containing protein [Sphingomonas sp. KSM1]
MGEIAGWIAPIATAIAAIMTASNLGTKVTGWGFVVFAVGSIAWITVALATDQTNLLLTNGFLTLVNIVGIWRWLGRQATYDKGAKAAEADSDRTAGPDLFQLGGLPGKAVEDSKGHTIAHVVDGMAESDSGRIAYLVVREGSELAERLYELPWQQIGFDQERIILGGAMSDLVEIDSAHWPGCAET